MYLRLDKALVERDLATSRSRAQFMVQAGVVLINGKPAKKTSQLIKTADELKIIKDINPWVSRSALKLEYAIKAFGLDPLYGRAIDIGSSTGGFTEVLLSFGCQEVYAIDVGRDQLHEKLKKNPRVFSFEGFNAKNLDDLEFPCFDYIVCDASFISIEKVLKVPLRYTKDHSILITLIKPQFEVGPKLVGKKGIVKDPKYHNDACEGVRRFLDNEGWNVTHLEKSPLLGSDGNVEFLMAANKLLR